MIKLDFLGQTALVTGGTRGIGKAVVNVLLELGADLIVTGTNKLEIDELNQTSNANNNTIKYLQADFLDSVSTENFEKMLSEIKRIDICINNAGINIIKQFTETQINEFNKIHDVNLIAPYRVMKIIGEKMLKTKYGRIVNVASIWGVITRPGRSMYTTSKHALIGLTKTLAVEWAASNILVNAVSPGFTMTELTKATNTEDEIKKIEKIIPINRFAEPNEIANTIAFLASSLNTYITGQNIIIDGGYTDV